MACTQGCKHFQHDEAPAFTSRGFIMRLQPDADRAGRSNGKL